MPEGQHPRALWRQCPTDPWEHHCRAARGQVPRPHSEQQERRLAGAAGLTPRLALSHLHVLWQ